MLKLALAGESYNLFCDVDRIYVVIVRVNVKHELRRRLNMNWGGDKT